MTEELFRDDSYLPGCDARIIGVDGNTVVLDRTVFYPMGGGQPGDQGTLLCGNGTELAVTDTRKSESGEDILHICDGPVAEELVGQSVKASINWERRHRLMRVHTLLHLLCSLVPAGVTGGAIRDDGTGRLDFDLAESSLDKAALTDALNALVTADHKVSASWITEGELDQNPELVRTMSVQPPRGQGRVRVLDIDTVDLQPCGGTHVASTAEIGEVLVRKIEKKGKHNRRVNVQLVS